jgi:Mor transcription activator family
MHIHISPHHLQAPVTPDDLQTFAELVPPTGRAIVRMIGMIDAVKVINTWRGAQIIIPKGACNNPGGAKRWAQLSAAVGEHILSALAQHLGGDCLDVPNLEGLRIARRNRAIVGEFDRLTAREPAGEALSKTRAVEQLAIAHHLSYRQIEDILDKPGFESVNPANQTQLF